MDTTKIDNIEFSDVYPSDAPDFCDAYISAAAYEGRTMTDKELDKLNENRDFVYEALMDELY